MNAVVDNRTRAVARVGQVLKEKWRLDSLLGIGGMAVVYSATHRNQKRVAIKMLLPELAGNAEVCGIVSSSEGYAANTIEHPGALSVLDDDVAEEGLPFLVMELLDGETVEARMGAERAAARARRRSPDDRRRQCSTFFLRRTRKGVVHRDVKPGEFVPASGSGGLKVLDFGIARVLEATRGRNETQAGTVMGTPAFMAPEQALAKWDEVDGRTDLWAVAATMFTLLSGQHVHEGANGNEQFVKSATQQARSIGSCVKGLPRSVIALVDRALQLRWPRTARWPDARAMQEAVRGAYEALTGVPLVIENPSSARSAPGTWSGAAGAPPVSSAVVGRPPPPPRTVVGPLQPTMPAAKAPPLPPRARTGSFRQAEGAGAASGPVSAGGPPAASRRSGAAFESADPSIMDLAASPARALAPPPMAALSMDAFIAGRTGERDAAAAEVAKYLPVVAEIQGRLAAVRRRVAQAQEQIAATRKDRASEEERFRRQMNARLEGVGEARKDFRRAMGEVARIALEDAAHFPADLGAPERAAIEKTSSTAAARAREDALHRAALTSFDPVVLKRGIADCVRRPRPSSSFLFFSPRHRLSARAPSDYRNDRTASGRDVTRATLAP